MGDKRSPVNSRDREGSPEEETTLCELNIE
jgi:hypothetical protein